MSLRDGKDGEKFKWGRTLREYPKLYPYYHYREHFAPELTFGENTDKQPNPLFMTALVKNGAGRFRWHTQDSHFDKIGSLRRSFYIPDGTRVQVLCQEERLNLQHLGRMGRLGISRKFTVVWNNRYTLNEEYKIQKGLDKDATVTLVKFGRSNKKTTKLGKVGKFLWKPFKWFGQGVKEIVVKPLGYCLTPTRFWRVAIIGENGKVKACPNCRDNNASRKRCSKCHGRGILLYTVKEDYLKHVAKDDPSQVRVGGKREHWEQFEMLGNVNKCNLTELRAGSGKLGVGLKAIKESDVPGYGELHGHCVQKKCMCKKWSTTKWITIYKCNYCTAEKSGK